MCAFSALRRTGQAEEASTPLTVRHGDFTMKLLLISSFLALSVLPCSGLLFSNDYDPDLLSDALNASITKVNAQSLDPNLYAVVTSSVRSVDFLDDDTFTISLAFHIQETTCTKDSGRDPGSCELQRGRYAQVASCKSWVEVSEEQVVGADVQCQRADTSSKSSSSSEEMFWRKQKVNSRQSNRNFASMHYSQTGPARKKNMLKQRPQHKLQTRKWDQYE
ncbi:secreted phosphoprotein 24 [Ambystoma mexicanum]|uniref:secreted phosphoprotein 24 n=1 Tax=Ambystoma mexicanum TaxID=8296 RepID=UPI0037E728C2